MFTNKKGDLLEYIGTCIIKKGVSSMMFNVCINMENELSIFQGNDEIPDKLPLKEEAIKIWARDIYSHLVHGRREFNIAMDYGTNTVLSCNLVLKPTPEEKENGIPLKASYWYLDMLKRGLGPTEVINYLNETLDLIFMRYCITEYIEDIQKETWRK